MVPIKTAGSDVAPAEKKKKLHEVEPVSRMRHSFGVDRHQRILTVPECGIFFLPPPHLLLLLGFIPSRRSAEIRRDRLRSAPESRSREISSAVWLQLGRGKNPKTKRCNLSLNLYKFAKSFLFREQRGNMRTTRSHRRTFWLVLDHDSALAYPCFLLWCRPQC